MEELSGASPPREVVGAEQGAPTDLPPAELPGSMVLLHKPRPPNSPETHDGGVPGLLPYLPPDTPGVGNGLRRPEGQPLGRLCRLAVPALPVLFPCCGNGFLTFKMKRLDWMTQKGPPGLHVMVLRIRRGDKRYPPQAS